MKKLTVRAVSYVAAAAVVLLLFPWSPRSPEEFRSRGQLVLGVPVVLYFACRFGLPLLVRRIAALQNVIGETDAATPTKAGWPTVQTIYGIAILITVNAMVIASTNSGSKNGIVLAATIAQQLVFGGGVLYFTLSRRQGQRATRAIGFLVLLGIGATFLASATMAIANPTPGPYLQFRDMAWLQSAPVWSLIVTCIFWTLRKSSRES